MNVQALLSLIADLYQQLSDAQARIRQLEQEKTDAGQTST